MRFRIQERLYNRVWDNDTKRWVNQLDGDYRTYRTYWLAVSAARRIRHPDFEARDKRIVEDKEFI